MALRGRMALIGKPGDNIAGYDSGAAYLYENDEQGIWNRVHRFVAADATGADQFGESVALDVGTALIGSFNTRETGSVYVFQEEGHGTWRQRAKLVPDIESPEDRFGSRIAISGNLAVIGASGSKVNTGAAYLFGRDSSGNWAKPVRLTPSDGGRGCFFGEAVALWDRTIIVGAPGNGGVYVFQEKAAQEMAASRQTHTRGRRVAFLVRPGSCHQCEVDRGGSSRR